ncbi:MAG: thioredoxin-dependent thiol peroxidase [Bdellovibrionota bacterium]
MIEEGKKAPAFSLKDDSGKKVSLSSFKGKSVVLYFYPKDFTGGCTQEACDFRDQFPTIKKKKAMVLGISRDPVEKHAKFREKYELPFPLLSDEKGEVCNKYGVWKQKTLYGRKFMGIERTTVVIGPDGKIKRSSLRCE